jgi:ubiquitin carboxyl-terminal hydrolase 7
LQQLHDDSGFLLNNKLVIRVTISPSNFSAGLKAGKLDTSYMNSLLHALYFVPMFRKVVYQLPNGVEKDCVSQGNLTLELQRVFYHLQFDSEPVGTKTFIYVLGMEPRKNTACKLYSVLLDDVWRRAKGTELERTVAALIDGRMRHFVKNGYSQSELEETFTGLSFNVDGCATLTTAFDWFMKEQDEYGLQPSMEGCEFLSLPSILHVHLRRHGISHDAFEFPKALDLSQFMAPNEAQGSPPIYELYAVLVHKKKMNTSHYWAYIQHQQEGKDFGWLKVNSNTMTRVSDSTVKTCSCGGFIKFTNAFMLVYLRVADLANLLAPIDKMSIPGALKFEQELVVIRKQKQKLKQKMHSWWIVTDIDLRDGPQVDLVDMSKVKKIKIMQITSARIPI